MWCIFGEACSKPRLSHLQMKSIIQGESYLLALSFISVAIAQPLEVCVLQSAITALRHALLSKLSPNDYHEL